MFKIPFLFFICLQILLQVDSWIYGPNGEDDWGRKNPDCYKNRQSPVNVKLTDTVYNSNLHPVKVFTSFDPRVTGIATKISAGNNGHSIFVNFGDLRMFLSGSDFQRPYQVLNAHFHWGANSEEGSEHRIDGKRFPLELHIVTFDVERYPTIEEAMNGSDSLAVIGVLFEISKKDNPYLEAITSNAKNMIHNGDKVILPDNFDILKLLPDTYETKYFRYLGSLTTPPCYESVIWTVAEMHNYVSERQMAELRKIKDYYNNTMVRNWRRTHELKARTVERSFQYGLSGAPKPQSVIGLSRQVSVAYLLIRALKELSCINPASFFI